MATLQVTIRRHRFGVKCAENDETAMRTAARAVEGKIKQLREKTGVADGERIALMAALQIAFESRDGSAGTLDFGEMINRIDGTLARTADSPQQRASNGVNQ